MNESAQTNISTASMTAFKTSSGTLDPSRVAYMNMKGRTVTPDTSESGSVTSANHVLATFIAEYSYNMSKQTSKRGKRRNAVDLFMSSTSTFQKAIKDEYDGALFDNDNVDRTDIDIHLNAAKCTFDQFFNAQGSISEMAEYLPTTLHEEGYTTPQAHIFGMIESHILIQFSNVFQNLNCVQSLLVASWIDDLLSKIEHRCTAVKKSDTWLTEYSKHVENFLDNGVRSKLKHVLQRMIARWSDNDGDKSHVVAGNQHMEEVSFVIDEHFKIAQRCLKKSILLDVAVATNEVISATAADVMVELCTKWTSIEQNRMCFIVNDSSELSALMQQRNEVYFVNHESKDIIDTAIQDLHDLSMCAINLLSERMMYDLQHSVATLSSIGNPEWERDENGMSVTTMLTTYRPMLVRTYNWLSSNTYFPMLLKNSFNLMLQSYMESFYSNTMTNGVTNPAAVATSLNRDYVNLVAYFNGPLFEQYQGQDGFYSTCEVNQRLQVIQCMSRLINPDVHPSELTDDAARLLLLTSHDGADDDNTAPILHLAGLRSSHCDERSIEWIQMLSNLSIMNDDQHQLINDILTIPDLRNSMYVRKMQPNHHLYSNEKLQRHISSVLSFGSDSKVALGKMILPHKSERTKVPVNV